MKHQHQLITNPQLAVLVFRHQRQHQFFFPPGSSVCNKRREVGHTSQPPNIEKQPLELISEKSRLLLATSCTNQGAQP